MEKCDSHLVLESFYLVVSRAECEDVLRANYGFYFKSGAVSGGQQESSIETVFDVGGATGFGAGETYMLGDVRGRDDQLG